MQRCDDRLRGSTRAYIGWGLAAYVTAVVYALTRQRPYFWDEVYHTSRADALITAPSLRAWLVENSVSAPGPLHALLLYALSGGNGAPPPAVARGLNFALLGATMVAVALVLRRAGQRPMAALAMMAVLMVWVVSGMALTEPLAVFGIAWAAVGAITWSTLAEDHPNGAFALVLLALGTAIATSTRQTYLAALPGLFLLAMAKRRDLVPVSFALAIGLVPVTLVVIQWRGLVPPLMAHIAEGWSPKHGFLAFAVTGVVAAILAPRLFWEHLVARQVWPE